MQPMAARLSIIVPTLGRPTLERTLASIAPQLGPEDEVIVVADAHGDVGRARRAVASFSDPRWRLERCDRSAPGPGNAQRQHGIETALGTHLLFMDDDDVYTPGALRLMRGSAGETPAIFRMDGRAVGLSVLWFHPVLMYAHVGTPMFIVPNDPARLGEWKPHLESDGGDFTFITGCCERMGEPVWREEIVAIVRPDGPTPSAPARSRRAPRLASPAPAP
jgi:glycosyltransferase involved in cell wall biosynthesis